MKRALILLTLLFSLPFLAFAAESDERVWFFSDSSGNNFQSVNLGLPIIYPLHYKAIWATGTAVDDTADPNNGGTYKSKVNVLGNVGCAYTDHQIIITISTDGRFVSQSDPTKYRDYYIQVKPKLRYGNNDYEYCWEDGPNRTGAPVDSEELVHNTKNGPVVLYTPQMKTHHEGAADTLFYAANASGKLVKSVSYTYDSAVFKNTASRFYCDLVIGMDQLTDEDEAHLATGSDYFSTININATCAEPGCSNPNHYLSFSMVIRGYYEKDKNSGRTVFMFVKPEADATNMDIESVITTQNQLKSGFDFTSTDDIVRVASQKIAELELFTLPRSTDFKTKITVLVTAGSSVANSNTTTNELFYLRHINEDIRIPFKVVIKSRNAQSNNPNSVFDGTSPSCKLNLGSADQKTTLDRQGAELNSLNYAGDVYVVLKDQATGIIKESVNGATVVYTDVTISDYLEDQSHTGLSGLYSSNIYYHIFLD